jgi:endonuclease/exonuclease/phosphatase family metal-dependent hydrolase
MEVNMKKFPAWVFVAALFAACDDVAGPGQDADFQAVRTGQDQIVVMTRNLFVGAAVEDVFDVASPEEIPLKAAEMWAAVQATDFETRAAAFAEEVSRFNPHLIGLQEVTTFYKQTPSDFDPGIFSPGAPAQDEELDFLDVYMDALAAAGLQYDVVAVAPHFTAEVPLFDPAACEMDPPCLSDMRLQDFDVILARSDVDYDPSTVVEANFPKELTLEMPPIGLPLPRGWASVDATVAGIDFRFAVTHLEPPDQDGVVIDELEELQRAQAVYLQGALLPAGLPVILVGDLNTDAYGQSTATYGDFLASGWIDTWGERARGYTCCQTEDLLTWPSILDRRVDLILMNGDFGLGPLGFKGGVHAWIVGNKGSDRTDGGLWPSDHAGVAAALRPHPKR